MRSPWSSETFCRTRTSQPRRFARRPANGLTGIVRSPFRARPASSRLQQPGAAGHECRDEHNRHDQGQFGSVDPPECLH
jgi:hypothetical protein